MQKENRGCADGMSPVSVNKMPFNLAFFSRNRTFAEELTG